MLGRAAAISHDRCPMEPEARSPSPRREDQMPQIGDAGADPDQPDRQAPGRSVQRDARADDAAPDHEDLKLPARQGRM